MDNLKKIMPSLGLKGSDWLKIAGGTFAGLVLFYTGKIWYSYKYFKKRGIKTPKYRFFYGNLPEIIKENYSDILRKWTEEYGKTYGYFDGHLPVLVTSDLEFIQEVFIKQFSNFSARKYLPLQISDETADSHLFMSAKGRWKRMRLIMNPTFTPARLKELIPLMSICSNRLMTALEAKANQEINISDFFDLLTMDTIFNCAFGVDVDCQNDPENIYLKKAKAFFNNRTNFELTFLFNIYFYELKKLVIPALSFVNGVLNRINDNLGDPAFWLDENVFKIIQKRVQNKVYRKDYAQLLIEALVDNVDTKADQLNLNDTDGRFERKLTLDELNKNLLLFLIAGYETTSATLGFCLFVLTKYPEEIKKLREEIERNFTDPNIEPEYDNIQCLEYLDMFVKEVLRMYPIANNVVTRRCTNPTKIKDFEFEKDMTIAVDVLSIHYDPELWGPEDPKEFYPLRFSPEHKRNMLAYLPFGIGPRLCIGMRFALVEIKLTLIKLLMRFDVFKTPNTPNEIHFREGSIRRPNHPIPVILKKRVLASA